METVSRIHVQKLPTTIKQQYKTENKRGIPKTATTTAAAARGSDVEGQNDAIGRGTQRARRQKKNDNDGQCRRHQREQGGGGKSAETATATGGGGRGETQGLVAGKQVLLLRRRQTG